MFHGVLTLLTRALRDDARRRRAHLFRLGGTLLILVFLIVAHATSGGIAAPGRRFFELISWLNLALIVLAGASYFATAITEEKEQGTLGLLQLAGVSTLGLLLGKSTSRLIAVLLIFLGQLPFALLAITLGGVTVRQIIAVDVALAAFLVMVANLGLLSSVVVNRSGVACAWVLLALFTLLLGVHYGDDSLSVLVRGGYLSGDSWWVMATSDLLSALQAVSINTRIEQVMETGFDGGVVGTQAWLHGLLGVAAFLFSWAAFNRFARYADVAVASRGWLPRRRSRWKLLLGRTWKWALVWKDYHFMTGGHALAALKLAAYPLLLVLMWRYQDALRTVSGEPFPILSRYVMLAVIGGEACLYASRMFHEELKWGTLPSLMTLPQPLAVIAYGKLAGCLLGLVPAVIVFLALVALVPLPAVQPAALTAGPAPWMLLMQFVVLLHLTVLYSLTVKWGALALAVGTLLILNALLSLPFSILLMSAASYGDDRAAVAPIIYFGCAAAAALQVLIALRLRVAAAR